MHFLMDYKDRKTPQAAHASEFAAHVLCGQQKPVLLGRKYHWRNGAGKEKTIQNCLQLALLHQYGSEFQFTVNKQHISEYVSSFNVMSSNQHRLSSENQKTLLHSWERRHFVLFY